MSTLKKHIVLAGIAAVLLGGPAWADFLPRCWNPTQGEYIHDPEFDQSSMMAVWQTDPLVAKSGVVLKHGAVMIAPIDAETGKFLLDQCITVQDARPVACQVTLNGPEWGYSARGSEVFFSRYAPDQQTVSIARISRDGTGVWAVSELPQTYAKGYPRVTINPADPDPWVAFNHYQGTLPDRLSCDCSGFRIDTEEPVDIALPDQAKHAHWIQGRSWSIWLENNRRGTLVYSADPTGAAKTEVARYSSRYAANYLRGWVAPELDDAASVMVGVHDTWTGESAVQVFHETAPDGWILWDTISPPAGYPLIHSPEPFVVNGRSYISAVALDDTGDESVVWIASVGAGTPEQPRLLRIVSEEPVAGNVTYKNDPETLIVRGGTTALVYYTDKGIAGGPDAIHQLMACETGL